MPRHPLAGPTAFRLAAALGLAACTDAGRAPSPLAPEPPGPSLAASSVASERVTAAALWNLRTREIIGRRGGSSNFAARTFALVSVAQYDAVIAAQNARDGRTRPSEAGAASAASGAVLLALYPAEQSFIEQRLADDAAYFPTIPSERGTDFAAGAAVGRTVAAAVIAYAASDGSNTPWDGTMKSGPGYWTPVSLPPQDATWGGVHPWLMSSGAQFHPAPPPLFRSSRFQSALAEIRRLSDARTPDQLRIAQYWASGYGPGGPAGYFGTLATQLGERQHFDERRMARTLAVMHMAIMDASIGCYEAKYTYWYIRPYQADPDITTPVGRPNFPSYPSAHSCLSAAAGGVLGAFFPASASDLRAQVQEAGVSRMYAGLHFRFEIEAGQELGRAVAALALRLAPDGKQAIPLD